MLRSGSPAVSFRADHRRQLARSFLLLRHPVPLASSLLTSARSRSRFKSSIVTLVYCQPNRAGGSP